MSFSRVYPESELSPTACENEPPPAPKAGLVTLVEFAKSLPTILPDPRVPFVVKLEPPKSEKPVPTGRVKVAFVDGAAESAT